MASVKRQAISVLQLFLTISVCPNFFAVPNEHGAALRDTDKTQQQPGPKVCQRKEQLGGAAAARGTDTAHTPSTVCS